MNLSREIHHLDTFGDYLKQNKSLKKQLARAGFFFRGNGTLVLCFSCGMTVDVDKIITSDVDILSFHRERRPKCRFFSSSLDPVVLGRPKKFLSYDSLRYEKERLETFIDWPLHYFLAPEDLAADGFYYLRTEDYCACVFCRGIVGDWDWFNKPRTEHAQHFPHCPFIKGEPVGNIPLKHSAILDKLPLDGEEYPIPPFRFANNQNNNNTTTATTKTANTTTGEDVVGSSSSSSRFFYEIGRGRHMPGSYPECQGRRGGSSSSLQPHPLLSPSTTTTTTTNESNDTTTAAAVKKSIVDYDEIGLRRYSGPKRKDYITFESRLKSYYKNDCHNVINDNGGNNNDISLWPERVEQKPEELAQAGFFYCGLSDHVRCFHCGGKLGLWEFGDIPWEEHARWYPDCHFIILSKGQEFIDKVRQEKPTPIRKDFITFESRLKSYYKTYNDIINDNDGGDDKKGEWPERVEQKPEELAQAGFFYCGLSDHVRCFQCGGGLRNWEIDDKPWEEHARWYPDCHFVIRSKGREFIDTVRREKPTYLRSIAIKGREPQIVRASSGKFKSISDADLDVLMESDIIKAVSDMGFEKCNIRPALRRRLERTGMPFLGGKLDDCVIAVLEIMEEETKKELQRNAANNNNNNNAAAAAAISNNNNNNDDSIVVTACDNVVTAGSIDVDEEITPMPISISYSSSFTTTTGNDDDDNNNNNNIEKGEGEGEGEEGLQPSSPGTTTTTTNNNNTNTGVSTIPEANDKNDDNDVIMAVVVEEEDDNNKNDDDDDEATTTTTNALSLLLISRPPQTTTTQHQQQQQLFSESPPSLSSSLPPSSSCLATKKRKRESMKEGEGEEDDAVAAAEEEDEDEDEKKKKEENEEKKEEKDEEEEEDDDIEIIIKATVTTAAAVSENQIQQQQQSHAEEEYDRICIICVDAEKNVVFLPCHHVATCSICAANMESCPVCRQKIEYIIKCILS